MASGLATGVLVVNLGSPDSTAVSDVRRYLRQFLMDGRVIDLPQLARWLLVHAIILPLRPKRSAQAYKKIWSSQGSPLLVEGRQLSSQLQASLGPGFQVELAMRYGQPSMAAAIDRLLAKPCERLIVVPLYPQYASATTGSIYEELMRVMQSKWNLPAINLIGDYYDHPGFIRAFVEVAKPQLTEFKPDHVLFSYHGLPIRHLQKSEGLEGKCLQADFSCCERIDASNRYCYRAQCLATSRALVSGLELAQASHSTSFQSRLGRAEWIRPYTDETVLKLAEQGYKRLAVLCPAFVADCLETLEEIGMEARESWLAAGGEDFRLISSLNSDAIWVHELANMIRAH